MRNLFLRIPDNLVIICVIFVVCINVSFSQTTPITALTPKITATPTPPYNPPFTLITDDATEIASNSATLNGTVVSDDSRYIVHCQGFEYGTASGLYTNANCEGSGLMVSGKRSAGIGGLSPVTTYYYRMYTIEKVGSAYGNEKSFTTLAVTPPVTPTPVCDAGSIEASSKTLKLKKEERGDVTVTVACADDSPVVSETVTAKIKTGKRCISVAPLSQDTDVSGQAIFTITATKKTGNAKVKFETTSGLKVTVTVKVRR